MRHWQQGRRARSLRISAAAAQVHEPRSFALIYRHFTHSSNTHIGLWSAGTVWRAVESCMTTCPFRRWGHLGLPFSNCLRYQRATADFHYFFITNRAEKGAWFQNTEMKWGAVVCVYLVYRPKSRWFHIKVENREPKVTSFISYRSARESCLLALEVIRRSRSILWARCDFIKSTWSGPSSFSCRFFYYRCYMLGYPGFHQHTAGS